MQPTTPATGSIGELLRALDLEDDVAGALHAQIARALESATRPTKRRSSAHAKARGLATQSPASSVDPLQLVALVLAVRDELKRAAHRGRTSRARGERLDLAADAALRALAAAARKSSASRRDRARSAGGASVQTDPAREILQRIVSLTPDAIVTVRASGRLGLWSAAASRLTGRRRWEIHRRGLPTIFAQREAFDTLLAELDARGRVAAQEVSLKSSGGEEVPVRIYGARLKQREGASGARRARSKGRTEADPDRYVLLFHDLTEVHHIRRRLIETEKLSAMAKIAGSVAHEFRNPLNSLFLSTDLLEDELEGSKQVRDSIAPTLAAIREEIERLNQIITHYLALSKISSASPEVVDLGAVVDAFAAENRERLDENEVELRIRSDDGDHRITADPDQMRRILVNLVENAVDAVTAGEGSDESRTRRGTVTLYLRRMRRSIKLTVKDNGPGIPNDLRERVFEPFFTSKAGGSGLGLYLVREIAIASGGTMNLSSSSTRGTSVSVRWPFAEDVDDGVSKR